MTYETAKRTCHVRSSIFRRAKPDAKYPKNHPIQFDRRVPWADQNATDWEEHDPRDSDTGSLSMFND